MTCRHKHGDQVGPFWICGVCYEKMSERPKRYGAPEIDIRGADKTVRPPQIVTWQAEVKKSGEGTTLGVFLRFMARHYVSRCKSLSMDDALGLAVDYLKFIEVQFGDPDYGWSRGCAIDLAEEDMTNWDMGDGHDGNT